MGKLRIDHVGSTWSFRTEPQRRPPETPRDGRTRNTVLLGLVLVAAFFWPVQLPKSMPPPQVQRDDTRGEFRLMSQPRGKPIFLNIEMLLAERTPPSLKFTCMVPGLFGVAVVFLAFARWSVRGVALIVLWAVPNVHALLTQDIAAMLSELPGELSGRFVLVIVLSFLAGVGLFVGSRARWYRPASRVAWVFGVAGGALYFISLLVPLEERDVRTMPVAMPWWIGKGGAPVIVVVAFVVAFAFAIGSAIFSIVNRPGGDAGRQRRWAAIAFALLVGAWVLGFAALLSPISWGLERAGGRADAVAFFATTVLKFAMWLVGLSLLLLMGLVDLIVGKHGYVKLPAERVAPPRPAPSVTSLAQLEGLHRTGVISGDKFARRRSEILGKDRQP